MSQLPQLFMKFHPLHGLVHPLLSSHRFIISLMMLTSTHLSSLRGVRFGSNSSPSRYHSHIGPHILSLIPLFVLFTSPFSRKTTISRSPTLLST